MVKDKKPGDQRRPSSRFWSTTGIGVICLIFCMADPVVGEFMNPDVSRQISNAAEVRDYVALSNFLNKAKDPESRGDAALQLGLMGSSRDAGLELWRALGTEPDSTVRGWIAASMGDWLRRSQPDSDILPNMTSKLFATMADETQPSFVRIQAMEAIAANVPGRIARKTAIDAIAGVVHATGQDAYVLSRGIDIVMRLATSGQPLPSVSRTGWRSVTP